MIAYRVIPPTGTWNRGGGLGCLCAILACFCIMGMLLFAWNPVKYKRIGLFLAGGSWLVLLGAMWLKVRRERRDWQVVEARCVDREVRRVWEAGGEGGGRVWAWRIVCEYKYQGVEYRVTPVINWKNFRSEKVAVRFLDKKIFPNGHCKIRVNPNNPLQTELFGQGIKDVLFYSK